MGPRLVCFKAQVLSHSGNLLYFKTLFSLGLSVSCHYFSVSLFLPISVAYSLSHSLLLSLCLSLSLSVTDSVSLSVSFYVSLNFSFSLSLSISLSPVFYSLSLLVPLSPSLSPHLYNSVILSSPLSVFLSIYLSTSVCLSLLLSHSISPSLCLSHSPCLSLSLPFTFQYTGVRRERKMRKVTLPSQLHFPGAAQASMAAARVHSHPPEKPSTGTCWAPRPCLEVGLASPATCTCTMALPNFTPSLKWQQYVSLSL